MAFRLADVKKTVRARQDGERYVHPRLLDAEMVGGQVDLALAYFHARLGRQRRDLDPELLVRFFGDPKITRGLVACLGNAYRWRGQTFADVLDAATVRSLARRGLQTPGDLRLWLFDALNREGDGFLAHERADNLAPLARRLRLAPAKLDQLVALDAEEHAVLVRVGTVPEAAAIVAQYNFQAVDALLRHSAIVELNRVSAAGRRALAVHCAAQGVAVHIDGETATLENQPDAFGSYARWGGRLARALYGAAAEAPELLRHGRAQVPLGGKPAWYLFERATVRALTGGAGVVRHGAPLPDLGDAWARRRGGAGGGWRMLALPEPVVGQAGLVLAPLACRRDETEVLLWPVSSPTALDDLRALHAAGHAVLGAVLDGFTSPLPDDLPTFAVEDGVPALIAALDRWWGQTRPDAQAQALTSLLDEAAARGFIAEAHLVESLGCASVDELPSRLTALDPARGAYVAGIGLCSPAFVETMRRGLRRKPRRQPAA